MKCMPWCAVRGLTRSAWNGKPDPSAWTAIASTSILTGPCKHLWATILAADAKGYLAEARQSPGLFADYGDIGLFDEEADEDGDEDEEDEPPPHRRPMPKLLDPQPSNKTPAWVSDLNRIASRAAYGAPTETWPSKREILYLVDQSASRTAGTLVLCLGSHDRKMDGSWTVFTPLSMKRQQLPLVPPADREILALLAGVTEHLSWTSDLYCRDRPLAPVGLSAGRQRIAHDRPHRALLPGDGLRAGWRSAEWDEGNPWRFRLFMRRGKRDRWVVAGQFARGETTMEAAAPDLVLPGGFVFVNGKAAALAADAAFHWLAHFRDDGVIEAPEPDGETLLAALLNAPGAPDVDVPEELHYEDIHTVPRPGLRIRAAKESQPGGKLTGDLSFDYNGHIMAAGDPSRGHFDAATRQFVRRDTEAEKEARHTLESAGLKFQRWGYGTTPAWEIAPSKLPKVVRTLVEAGWHIEADGKTFRRPGAVAHGRGQRRGLVRTARRRGVRRHHGATCPRCWRRCAAATTWCGSDDGTYGLLPEEWLKQYRPAGRHGRGARTATSASAAPRRACWTLCWPRSRRPPATRPSRACARSCAQFHGRRSRAAAGAASWASCATISAKGWAGWSFCAASASAAAWPTTWAWARRRRCWRCSKRAGSSAPAGRRRCGPSLVVVPRSLVFNWKQEAARFTPQAARPRSHRPGRVSTADLRRLRPGADDLRHAAPRCRCDLKDIEFDYVVLDEAQAIKNAATESAKAVRLLRGNHRLALSGTPVENHLGELWSLFEFLNPGMLGAASVFKLAGAAARNPERRDARAAGPRAAAVHPAPHQRAGGPELPPKTEQTIYCELEPAQRKLYDELRAALPRLAAAADRARRHGEIEDPGAGGAAAVAAGGVPSRSDRPQTRAANRAPSSTCCWTSCARSCEEGHKALVFSQFTSLLAHRARAPGRSRRHLRIPRRRDARPAGARGALPERSGSASCS